MVLRTCREMRVPIKIRGDNTDNMFRDYWMDADGAVSYGMVDKILGTKNKFQVRIQKEFR